MKDKYTVNRKQCPNCGDLMGENIDGKPICSCTQWPRVQKIDLSGDEKCNREKGAVKMFLVIKRFPLDDIPLCLVTTKGEELMQVVNDHTKTRFATATQEDLMGCNIGCEAVAYMIIEFDSKGLPIKSEIFPLQEGGSPVLYAIDYSFLT